jgi:hypothetical protein
LSRVCDNRRYAAAVLALFVGAVFAPTALGRPDSFPLSTYPMFAKHRGQPEIVKFVAVTDRGEVAVPPDVLGTGEVLQAKALLGQVARKSAKQRLAFCKQTANRAAPTPLAANWQELRLLQVRYDPIGYFEGGGAPLSERELTRCRVSPKSPPKVTDPTKATRPADRALPAESRQ